MTCLERAVVDSLIRLHKKPVFLCGTRVQGLKPGFIIFRIRIGSESAPSKRVLVEPDESGTAIKNFRMITSSERKERGLRPNRNSRRKP